MLRNILSSAATKCAGLTVAFALASAAGSGCTTTSHSASDIRETHARQFEATCSDGEQNFFDGTGSTAEAALEKARSKVTSICEDGLSAKGKSEACAAYLTEAVVCQVDEVPANSDFGDLTESSALYEDVTQARPEKPENQESPWQSAAQAHPGPATPQDSGLGNDPFAEVEDIPQPASPVKTVELDISEAATPVQPMGEAVPYLEKATQQASHSPSVPQPHLTEREYAPYLTATAKETRKETGKGVGRSTKAHRPKSSPGKALRSRLQKKSETNSADGRQGSSRTTMEKIPPLPAPLR